MVLKSADKSLKDYSSLERSNYPQLRSQKRSKTSQVFLKKDFKDILRSD